MGIALLLIGVLILVLIIGCFMMILPTADRSVEDDETYDHLRHVNRPPADAPSPPKAKEKAREIAPP